MSPVDFDQLSDEKIEEFINSPIFQRYYAYRGLADGIDQLKQDDVMYNQLVKGILQRVNRVKSEETIEKVLDAFVEEVEDATEMAVEEKQEQNNEWENDLQ